MAEDFGTIPEYAFGMRELGESLQKHLPVHRGENPFEPRSVRLTKTKKLRPRHRNVLMLHEAGYTNAEIASMVGYTPARVSVILSWKDPEILEIRKDFRNRVVDKTAEVGTKVQLMAGEMLDIMVGHARKTENANNSRLAARDILHMAGYSPVKRIQAVTTDVPFEEVKSALKQIDKADEAYARREEWVVQNPKDGTNG